MKRTEFKKFLKTLSKEELMEIVLDLTKRKTELTDNIYFKYSKAKLDTKKVEEEIKKEIDAIYYKVFTKSFMIIGSSVVSKYATHVRKIIKDKISLLVDAAEYSSAFKMLILLYKTADDDLGFAIYKYSSGDKLRELIYSNWEKVYKKATDHQKIVIYETVRANIDFEVLYDPFLMTGDSLEEFYFEHFNTKKWREFREETYARDVEELEKKYGDIELIPDEDGMYVLGLFDAKNENEMSEEEKQEFLEKYHLVFDINNFQINELIREKKYAEALDYIDELEKQNISRANRGNNLIKKAEIYRLEDNTESLRETLREYLKNYKQEDFLLLLEYLSLFDKTKREEEFKAYKNLETTESLYQNSDFLDLYKIENALLEKDYTIPREYKNSFVDLLIPSIPHAVFDYYIAMARETMKKPATEANYKEAMEWLCEAKKISAYASELEKIIEGLIEEYRRRSKLKWYLEQYGLIDKK